MGTAGIAWRASGAEVVRVVSVTARVQRDNVVDLRRLDQATIIPDLAQPAVPLQDLDTNLPPCRRRIDAVNVHEGKASGAEADGNGEADGAE